MKRYLLPPLFFLSLIAFSLIATSNDEGAVRDAVIAEELYDAHPLSSEESVHLQDFSTIPTHPEHANPDMDAFKGWFDPIEKEKESDTFQAKFFNMLFILALLIAFMFVASWALKRMMKSKLTNMNVGSTIKVIESRYISPRATLHVVTVNDKTFLIAESPTTVTYLASFPAEEGEA